MSSPPDTARLFEDLARTADYVDRRGWAHTRCPNCGKEPATRGGRKASHFSFGYDRTRSTYYGKCFVCGFSCGLVRLAEQFGVAPSYDAPTHRPRRQEPRKPASWTQNPSFYLDKYLSHPRRLELWQAYKPLDIDTIARFRLGVGTLPASQCKRNRLIVPVFVGGQVVGFRGRAYLEEDDDAKWLTCGSSQTVLYNGDLLKPGVETVIVAENMIDCLLAMQDDPTVVAVASTAGVATWRDEWTRQIVAARPREVIVWTDNDLAGQPNPPTYRALCAERRARGLPLVEPHGPKIANKLLEAHLPVTLYTWPVGTPPKADLGWALAQ